jgi:hypothetical protein
MAFKGVIPAPPVVEAPFGLFSAAEVVERGPRDEHWGQGFEAMTEACNFDASIHDVCGAIPPVDVYVNNGDRFVSVRPFGILARDECSAVGFSVEDRRARVTRQLELVTQKSVEAEFWRGVYRSEWETEQANLDPSWVDDDTAYLSSANTTALEATAQSPKVALALLEQGLADCGPGYEGVIHMSPLVASTFAGLLEPGDDGKLRTMSGHRVAIGAGYDGSGPNRVAPANKFTHWMYATGPMFVVLGSKELITVNEQQATNAGTNMMTYVAARPAAVYSDGCCQLAVQADIRI